MKLPISSLLLSGLIMTACSGVPKDNIPVTDTPSTDTPLQVSSIEIAYVALDDNGASGPLVGCGDSEVLVEKESNHDWSAKDRIKMALETLLSNKEQFVGESGLYNALYQSTLTVDSVTIKDGTATVELSGEVLSGGECDDPRIVDQIRATVENNLDSDKKFTLVITINGKPLEKIQDLSGQ